MAAPRVLKFRYVCTAWCVLESVLFGGLFFGWASLVYVFKQEGIYSFLCSVQDGHYLQTNFSFTGTNKSKILLPLNLVMAEVPRFGANMSTSISEYKTNYDDNFKEYASIPTGCKEQDAMLNLWFTVAVSVLSISTSLIGYTLYRFGPMILRFLGSFTFCGGALMLAFADNSAPWLICPGLFFIAFGAVSISAANLQVVPFLYVRGSSIAVSLLTGFYYSAATTQWLIKVAFEHGISRQHSYLILTSLNVVIVTTNSLLFFRQSPHTQIELSVPEVDEEQTYNEQFTSLIDKTSEKPPLEKMTLETGKEESRAAMLSSAINIVQPTLKSCVFNRTFLLHLFWFVVNDFYLLTFIGVSNSMLERFLLKDVVKVNHFTDVFSFSLMCAAFFSVIGGLLYDCQRMMFRDYKGSCRHLLPAVFPIAMTTFLGAITVGLQFVKAEEVLYVLFIVFVVYKQCVFALTFSFIVDVYPSEYFGVFYGIVFTVAGLVLFLQYAVFNWLNSSAFSVLHVNAFFFCLILLSLANPVNLLAQGVRGQRSTTSNMEEIKMKPVKSSSV